MRSGLKSMGGRARWWRERGGDVRDGGGSEERREGSGRDRGGGRWAAALMVWRGRARWCRERGGDVRGGGEREERGRGRDVHGGVDGVMGTCAVMERAWRGRARGRRGREEGGQWQ